MRLVVPRDPEIASLWRRSGALLVDMSSYLGVLAVGAAAAFKLLRRLGHRPDWFELGARRRTRGRGTIAAASRGVQVAGRNWRTPGMRLLGLRRVDARTGGPVGVLAAVSATTVDTLVELVAWSLGRRGRETAEAARTAAEQEIARVRDSGLDGEALSQQAMDAYRRHDVSAWPAVWPSLATVAATRVIALWSGRRQTLPQRVAGTVIVRCS
jgi:hypothetical protein